MQATTLFEGGQSSGVANPPLAITQEVRDGCLSLHLQRAARMVARRFDDAFRPFEITNGQFSILVSLHRPQPPTVGQVAHVLAMDRTTVTAAIKVLDRRGLVESMSDRTDGRLRRLHLTAQGRDVIRDALPVWRATHLEIAAELPGFDLDSVRSDLRVLSTSNEDARVTRLS